jgi:hypothetical protein
MKPVLFLYAVGFLVETKTLHKRKRKIFYLLFRNANKIEINKYNLYNLGLLYLK